MLKAKAASDVQGEVELKKDFAGKNKAQEFGN